MALQTRDLSMMTLGVLGDAPPNDMQPPLPDGMHLRWSFEPAKGFPWYGYYLFRRPTREKQDRTCISRYLYRYKAGAVGSDQLAVGTGRLSSDEALILTEDFPPPGMAEVDLDDRSYVRYDAFNDVVHWVEATIGFRKPERPNDSKRTCVDFRREKPRTVDNPLTRQEARFLAFDGEGKPLPTARIASVAGNVGWSFGVRGAIQLPCVANQVQLVLAHGARAPKIVALDSSGNPVDTATMSSNGPETVTLSGEGIRSIGIDAPQAETVVLRVCWTCGRDGEGNRDDEIRIPLQAHLDDVLVDSDVAVGKPGDVVRVRLTADAIDRIDIGSGPAALIDLCVVSVRAGARGAPWELLDDLQYPICLPVAHGDYPCPGAPATPNAAEARAMDRIVYGPAAPWAGASFDSIHDRLERLVDNGPPPGGASMHARFEPVAGAPAPPPEVGGAITQQQQRPLELLLLGSLQPPVAQMLGLYWLDKTAVPGEHYDYLLVADHDGSLGGNAAAGLLWVNTVWDFTVNDGFVAFDRVVEPATPLTPPNNARAYALPGATVAPNGGGAVIDATNNAGVTWNRRVIAGILQPDAPVMYHVWRADLGNVEVPGHPADGDFNVLTERAPLPVGRSIVNPPQTPQRPDDWPPFPLNYIDRGRPDGWYAYRVNGVDIFGRHSANSASAAWRQWTPALTPRPWYYIEPPSDAVIDGSRIRLLDKIPPPPPTGVEAFALDPEDPTVLHDAAWQTWRNSLSEAERATVIGLRVRWRWDRAQQRQAPDTREFRIYYEPAPLNTLRGRVTSTTAAGASETDVATDIPNTQPANSFAGLSVRIGAQSFRIVSSTATSPLRFRVENIGASDEIRPASRARCALSLQPGHALYEDFSNAPVWQDRMLAVAYADHVTVDSGDRIYEVLLPVAGSANRAGLPLTTSLEEPMSAAMIGVTAADDKQHTHDHRGDAQRYGNESSMGGPATVLRVRREKPPAPAVPPDSGKVWASQADYHGHSFYTYRWLPSPSLKTFVYRALDDAVFQADAAARPRTELQATDLGYFPDEATEPTWDAVKRAQIATELNTLNGVDMTDKAAMRAAYGALSNDALRVLAALPGTEKVFVQLTHLPLDPEEPDAEAPGGVRWRRVGPDVATTVLTGDQLAFVDTLDGKASNRYFYRAAYVDEVQNVGSLSLSSPPVWLPDVSAPVAPRIAKVVAGERQITLEWTSNRERDLAEYRIYRTDDADAARDIRLMDLVHSVAVAEGDPADRPKSLTWVDDPVPGLRDLWYRLVALDRVDPDPKGGGGNVSSPSPAMRTRAFDETPPEPPALTTLEWVRVDESDGVHAWADAIPAGETWVPSVRITWAAAGAGDKLLLQYKGEHDGGFRAASPWLEPGTTSFLHRTDRTAEALEYRLKTVSDAGNANVVFHPSTLAIPA
jgi:hypothetical protein